VIVVGAGAAGLYATYELTNMGFDVKVLEAQDDHGGRVSDDGGFILGTSHPLQFCGSLHYPKNWLTDDINALDKNRLANAFPDDKNHTTAYNLGGELTTGWDAGKKDFPELFDYWDFYYNADEYTGPDVDAETGICDYKGICKDDPVTGVYYHLYDAGYPGGENSTSPHAIGMRSLAVQEGAWTIGIGEWGFTNATVLETLDELYFNSILSKVQVDTPVTAIDTSVSPAAVTAAGVGTFYGHAVLVTVPLGVLKAGDIAFTPALSAAKQAAIANIGFGGAGGKYFLKFTGPVWPAEWVSIHTPGLAGYCWMDHWYKVNTDNDVLTCFTFGDNAAALAGMTEQDQITAILSALDSMIKPDKQGNQSVFTDAFVSGFWARGDVRPYLKGAYSWPAIGTYPTDGSPSMRQVLAEPVGTSLYFAGEASDHAHPETIYGALDSGLRAAGEIDADHNPQ
jgi:hypothetical protein